MTTRGNHTFVEDYRIYRQKSCVKNWDVKKMLHVQILENNLWKIKMFNIYVLMDCQK